MLRDMEAQSKVTVLISNKTEEKLTKVYIWGGQLQICTDKRSCLLFSTDFMTLPFSGSKYTSLD